MKKIYLFAVIFALAAGFATWFFINGLQHNSAVTGIEEADVVIALKDIEKDTLLTADMFTVVRMPASAVSYGTVVRASDITGYVAADKIYRGEQVLAAKLVHPGEQDGGLEYNGEYRLAYHISKGQYAYTIAVTQTDTVADFIRRGDYINLYTDEPGGDVPFLANVEVLEIGTYSDKVMELSGTPVLSYTYFTLLLDKTQLEKMIRFDNAAPGTPYIFNIALVSYEEGAGITTMPETTVLNEAGEPVTRAPEPETNRGMGEFLTTTTLPDAG